VLQLQDEITRSLEETLNIEFPLEIEMREEIFLETGETEAHFEECFINEETENSEDNEGLSDQGEVCFEGETALESQRLLAADININIDVHMNIETEKNQEENIEQQHSTPPLIVPNIDPGNQECEQVTICRYTIIPRVGKKCLCQQELSCS